MYLHLNLDIDLDLVMYDLMICTKQDILYIFTFGYSVVGLIFYASQLS